MVSELGAAGEAEACNRRLRAGFLYVARDDFENILLEVGQVIPLWAKKVVLFTDELLHRIACQAFGCSRTLGQHKGLAGKFDDMAGARASESDALRAGTVGFAKGMLKASVDSLDHLLKFIDD